MLRSISKISDSYDYYQDFKDNSCKVYLKALLQKKLLRLRDEGDQVTILADDKTTDVEDIKKLLPADTEFAIRPQSKLLQISINKESLMKFFIDVMKTLFDLAQQKTGQKAEIQPDREFVYYCENDHVYNCKNDKEGIRLDYRRSDALKEAFEILYKDFGMVDKKPRLKWPSNNTVALNISDVPKFISAQRMQYQLPEVLLDSLPKLSSDVVNVVYDYLSEFSMFNRPKNTSLVVSNPKLESSKKLTS